MFLLKIGLTAVLILFIACSSATRPDATMPPIQEPLLNSEQVGDLVFTYLFSSLDEIPSFCASAFIAPEGGRGSYTAYMGNHLWVVAWEEGCAFTVSDENGKVLGP